MNTYWPLHLRRSEILLPFDLVSLSLAWYLTTYARLVLNPVFVKQLTYHELVQVAPPLGGMLLVWTIVWFWLGRGPADASVGTSLLRVADATVKADLLAIVLTFFSRNLGADLSRSFVLLFLPVSFAMLMAGRYISLFTIGWLDRRWQGTERVAVIGKWPAACALVEKLRHAGQSAPVIAGVILPERALAVQDKTNHPVPVLGTTTRLAEVINQARLTRLVVLGDSLTDTELDHCVTVSVRMGVTFSRHVGAKEPMVRIHIADLGDLQLLEMRPVAFTRHQEIAKRTLDVLCSALPLLVLFPLLAIVAFLIKLSSRGPILYVSTRVGKGGRHFTFLKFRTMYTGSEDRRNLAHKNEKTGHIFKIRNDPRTTPIGRVLRRWSIDELPQLINVLRGDMSMVGPRPLPASDLDPDGQSQCFCAWAEQRCRVLPGITGLWQIRGRSDLPFNRMVELDMEYISAWSLKTDLRILLETPIALVTGRGAY